MNGVRCDALVVGADGGGPDSGDGDRCGSSPVRRPARPGAA